MGELEAARGGVVGIQAIERERPGRLAGGRSFERDRAGDRRSRAGRRQSMSSTWPSR